MHLNVRLPAERRAESESDRDLSKAAGFEIVDKFYNAAVSEADTEADGADSQRCRDS
jgi:uncharacterized protein (DUF2147 family)